MRSFRTWLTRGTALFFAVMVVITIPLSLAIFQAGQVLFNPELMKSTSVEVVTGADLLPRMMNDVMQRGDEGEEGEGDDDPALKELFLRLDQSEWKKVTAILLPDEVLAAYMGSMVDGLYNWLDSDQPLPEITLDLTLLRGQMTGPQGESLAQVFFESLPPCSQEQVDAFLRDPSAFQSPKHVFEMSCKMPGLPRDQQVEVYELVLARLSGEIPPRVNVVEELGGGDRNSTEDIANVKRLLRILRWGTRWSWVLPLICLLLVALFAVRSVGGLGGWWGIPITTGSGMALAASIFLPPTLFRLFADRVASRVPPYLEQVGLEVMMRVIREIFHPMRLKSLVGVIAGLVLISLLVLWDWRRRNRPSLGTETERMI